MGTKAQLLASIISDLTPVIDDVDVISALGLLVDEIYPETFTMQVADASGVFSYKINFEKIGNNCFINGYFHNQTSSMLTPTIGLVEITNPLYLVKTGTSVNLPIMNVSTFSNGGIILFGGFITLQSNIGVGSKVSFNGSYKLND